MKNKRVAVIGAGCSGITAVKNLLQAGVEDVVCFEKADQLGGNWVYSENNRHSSVCETTHIISSKTMSQYIDFPMPEDYPDYPSHAQVLAYFQSYARHFGLEQHIRYNTGIQKAELLKDQRWRLTTAHGDVEEFDYLLVANGHHNDPRYPAYQGNFSGDVIHSHDYKNNRDDRYVDKRVLIIGAGNSGCDCAVEISRVAAQVDISMRRGYYIVPKFFLGKPTDTFNKTLKKFPKFLQSPLRKMSLRIQVGDYRSYGLQKPDYPLLKSHPVVNSELLYKIRHGKVHPKKDIARFEGKIVHFTDGTSAEYDTIVTATGYKITFPFFDKDFINFDFDATDRVPLYLRTFHPEHPSLFFIGLVQPQGAVWPLSDVQAKLVANHIMGRWQRPSNIQQLAEKDADRIAKEFMKTARHTIEVHFHQHFEEVRRQIPKNAPEWQVAIA